MFCLLSNEASGFLLIGGILFNPDNPEIFSNEIWETTCYLNMDGWDESSCMDGKWQR